MHRRVLTHTTRHTPQPLEHPHPSFNPFPFPVEPSRLIGGRQTTSHTWLVTSLHCLSTHTLAPLRSTLAPSQPGGSSVLIDKEDQTKSHRRGPSGCPLCLSLHPFHKISKVFPSQCPTQLCLNTSTHNLRPCHNLHTLGGPCFSAITTRDWGSGRAM